MRRQPSKRALLGWFSENWAWVVAAVAITYMFLASAAGVFVR